MSETQSEQNNFHEGTLQFLQAYPYTISPTCQLRSTPCKSPDKARWFVGLEVHIHKANLFIFGQLLSKSPDFTLEKILILPQHYTSKPLIFTIIPSLIFSSSANITSKCNLFYSIGFNRESFSLKIEQAQAKLSTCSVLM